MPALGLRLTPQHTLIAETTDDAEPVESKTAERILSAFDQGTGHGLLHLGSVEVGTPLAPVLAYWRDFAVAYVTAVCRHPQSQTAAQPAAAPVPQEQQLDQLALAAPPMAGAEYISRDCLAELWQTLNHALGLELDAAAQSLQDFLKARHPAWHVVGRVHFNLAENRKDPEAPFAFLATYTTRLSAAAKAQHLPLGEALKEFKGTARRQELLALLSPVQTAASECSWLQELVESGAIYQPLRWAPAEAMALLRDAPALERAGIIVRMPAAWRMNRPPRPQVRATVGDRTPSGLGLDALLDFQMEVTLNGERLTQAELRALLQQSENLVLIRGQWVEVDRERLQRTLDQFQAIERSAKAQGIGFIEASRLLSSTQLDTVEADPAIAAWSEIVAGKWLAETLQELRNPARQADAVNPGAALRGTLRPYQQHGLRWLQLLTSLRLGACLADDMGLGKTIQVLALLLIAKRRTGNALPPSLLIVPASLVANWSAEAERFAPSLQVYIAHPSAVPAAKLKTVTTEQLTGVDFVITTYNTLARLPWLSTTRWQFVILDEAQAIKNPGTKQTKAVKCLQAEARIALTGTPIENRLGDLWSIFDFINPGLLGSAKQFSGYIKGLATRTDNPYAPLRNLVRPYILRRLKTDKSIIADLPDKTELKSYCALSRKQVALYEQAVANSKRQLLEAEGIQRRGMVLALLMRLKQICNHPSQWLGDGAWDEQDSGKFARLRELVETIAAKQEKVLVFTQFRETTEPLAAFLATLFGRSGLILHGQTSLKRRKELVQRFQEDERVPFFLLSLKAGGTGLNLTAAAHVIHFDRWWNPAVERQATDRAFRIGQTRNVLVHKFICRGTVEDKIDQMIDSKQQLAGDILEPGAEINLTELRDDELLQLISLDLNAATKET